MEVVYTHQTSTQPPDIDHVSTGSLFEGFLVVKQDGAFDIILGHLSAFLLLLLLLLLLKKEF